MHRLRSSTATAVVSVLAACTACTASAPRTAHLPDSRLSAPSTAPSDGRPAITDSLSVPVPIGNMDGLLLPVSGPDDLRLPGVTTTFNLETCDLVFSITDEAIGFAFDSAEITPAGLKLLALVARKLVSAQTIGLFGYTSTEGDAGYNVALSFRRAQAVADVLARSLPVVRFDIHGEGESHPLVSPDDTEAKREQNRRVELHTRIASKQCRRVAP